MFKKFWNNPHITELLHKGALSVVMRIAGAGLTFFLYVYLARLLGAYDYGLLILAFTIISVLSVVVRMGLDNVLIRHIASSIHEADFPAAKGHLKVGLSIALFTGVVLTTMLYFSADWISQQWLSKPDLSRILTGMSWMLVPFSLAYLMGEALKGVRYIWQSVVVQVMVLPSASLIMLFAYALLEVVNVDVAVSIYVIASVMALAIGFVFWYQAIPKGHVVSPHVSEMLKSGMPLLLATSGAWVMSWADTVVLGVYESSDVVGAYNAASRTAMLTSLILISVNAITAPKFAAFYASKDMDGLIRLAKQSSLLMTLMVVIPTLVLFALGDWILGFFGDGFVIAYGAMMVLVAGQFVNVACGSVAYILSMTGNERIVRDIMLIVSVLNIILNVVLIKAVGMIGVALATAISTALWNVWMVIVVRNKFGFLIFDYRTGLR